MEWFALAFFVLAAWVFPEQIANLINAAADRLRR
jgi:hypothetical protein